MRVSSLERTLWQMPVDARPLAVARYYAAVRTHRVTEAQQNAGESINTPQRLQFVDLFSPADSELSTTIISAVDIADVVSIFGISAFRSTHLLTSRVKIT